MVFIVFSIIYANQSSYKIVQSRGEFRWPYGEGKAYTLKLGPPFFGVNNLAEQDFKIEQKSNVLKVFNDRFSYSAKIKDMPINEETHISWKNLNLDEENLKLALGHFSFETKNSQAWIYGVNLNCRKSTTFFSREINQIISDCLSFADISVDGIRKLSYGPTDGLESILNAVLSEHFSNNQEGETKITDMSGRVRGNQFDMYMTTHLDMSVKINIKGQITQDLDKNEIIVNIKKAKAGFFNIRDKLFREFAKIQNNRIIVRSPYIYIKLGE